MNTERDRPQIFLQLLRSWTRSARPFAWGQLVPPFISVDTVLWAILFIPTSLSTERPSVHIAASVDSGSLQWPALTIDDRAPSIFLFD